MRRRLREQRRVREALLLDLGALVYELHRQGKRAPELLQEKAAELTVVDDEVRELEATLGAGLPEPEPEQPRGRRGCDATRSRGRRGGRRDADEDPRTTPLDERGARPRRARGAARVIACPPAASPPSAASSSASSAAPHRAEGGAAASAARSRTCRRRAAAVRGGARRGAFGFALSELTDDSGTSARRRPHERHAGRPARRAAPDGDRHRRGPGAAARACCSSGPRA